MKILDYLYKEEITTILAARDKAQAISELVKMLANTGKIKNMPEIIDALIQREKLGSTGIGQGVAIPHCRTDLLTSQVAALGISREGIDFESVDGAPVQIVFLLVSPGESVGEPGGTHLQAMARISRLLKEKSLRQSLLHARTPQEIVELISKADVY